MIKVGDIVLKDNKDIWLIVYAFNRGNEYMFKYLNDNKINTIHIRSSKNLSEYKDMRIINV